MNGISGTHNVGVHHAPDQTGVSTAGRGRDIAPAEGFIRPLDRTQVTDHVLGDRVSPGRRFGPISLDQGGVRGGREDIVRLSPSGRAAAAVARPLAPDERMVGEDAPRNHPRPNSIDSVSGMPTPSSMVPSAAAEHSDGHAHSAGNDAPTDTDPPPSGVAELSPEEERHVAALAARDREVRAHEQAHKAAGGQHTGAISLSYTTGPDGKRYATSGEVPVDLSPVAGDPEATIRKLEQIERAALAPANPSSADRRVAARAARLVRNAQREVLEEAMEEKNEAPLPEVSSRAAASSEDVTSAADTGPRRGTRTGETDASGSVMPPIEAAKQLVGNSHRRQPSVGPDAQAPVKLNLSVYA